MEEKFASSIYVSYKPVVLVRLDQTFARRGYNIDSLVVSPAHNPHFSRFTVVAQGEPETFNQITTSKVVNKSFRSILSVSHCNSEPLQFEFHTYITNFSIGEIGP